MAEVENLLLFFRSHAAKTDFAWLDDYDFLAEWWGIEQKAHLKASFDIPPQLSPLCLFFFSHLIFSFPFSSSFMTFYLWQSNIRAQGVLAMGKWLYVERNKSNQKGCKQGENQGKHGGVKLAGLGKDSQIYHHLKEWEWEGGFRSPASFASFHGQVMRGSMRQE